MYYKQIHSLHQPERMTAISARNLRWRNRILISEEIKCFAAIFTFSPSIPGIPGAPREPFSPFCPGNPGTLVWHTLQAFWQNHKHTQCRCRNPTFSLLISFSSCSDKPRMQHISKWIFFGSHIQKGPMIIAALRLNDADEKNVRIFLICWKQSKHIKQIWQVKLVLF